MGNDFDEDRIGTITSEFHERELDVDRIRNVADVFQSSCVISERLSFWFLPDVAVGWWHFDIAWSPFRRAAGWTASRAVYKSDLWSLPLIQSRHLVRRRRLLVLVMLVLPVERCRTKLQRCTRGGCSDGHIPLCSYTTPRTWAQKKKRITSFKAVSLIRGLHLQKLSRLRDNLSRQHNASHIAWTQHGDTELDTTCSSSFRWLWCEDHVQWCEDAVSKLVFQEMFASRDTPSAPLSDDWWPVWKDRCHLVHFDWLKRVQRLRFCQLVDVILSRSTVRLPASLSHLFTFSWPLLVLVPLMFRTRSVDFFKDPNELLSTLRCFGHIVRFDLVHLPAHLLWRRIRLTTWICGMFA